jgi:hypothetical protein
MLRPALPTLALLLAGTAMASEGMWTLDNFPIERANRELGTRIDEAWLDRMRTASVKLGTASGGLVSPEGLILTNEHVVSDCVEDLSTAGRNYGETGFTPVNRSILVTTAAVAAALRHAYGMGWLLREIGTGADGD